MASIQSAATTTWDNEYKLENDYKRAADHRHKWHHGQAVLAPGQPNPRPMKAPSQNVIRYSRREVEFQVNKAAQISKIARKHDSRLDSDTAISDSSAEEDVKEASAAPVPDAGITYSFDAARGPGRGSQILGMALAKAVEKFETKQVEKLVKDEYEVVGKESDDGNDGYVADEDDFMLV